jgi:hypothetical protein
MGYKRNDIESTIESAKRCANRDNIIYYVFATAYGYTINKSAPYWQKSYMVRPASQLLSPTDSQVTLKLGSY